VLAFVLFGASQTYGLAFVASDSDGQSLHGKIVKEALSSTLNGPNLDLVIRSLDQEATDQAKNATLTTGSDAVSVRQSVAFVDREQKKILNYAAEADVSPANRYHCLKHFGQLLLVAQDFYSRSNYVEVESERLAEKLGKSGFDPYNIELVDWNKLTIASRQNQILAFGPATMAKEDPSQSKATLGATTYYKAARELAVRETAHQWEVLEALIKQRYHERAVTILAALKQASCPATEPDDLD
jgi:hypothetical protein